MQQQPRHRQRLKARGLVQGWVYTRAGRGDPPDHGGSGGGRGTGSGRPAGGDAARPGYRPGETLTWLIAGDVNIHVGSRSENLMSKGTDSKKEVKKKPAKTLKQKQADKKSKKATQRSIP